MPNTYSTFVESSPLQGAVEEQRSVKVLIPIVFGGHPLRWT